MKGRNAYDVMKQLAEDCTSDQRISTGALGVQKELQKANNAYNEVRSLADDVMTWEAKDYDEKRAAAEDTMKMFREQFKVLLDFHPSLMMIKAQITKKKVGDRRSAREKTKTFSASLQSEGGLPASFADYLAEYSTDRGSKLLEEECSWHSPMLLEQTSAFDRPLKVQYGNGDETHWHQELNNGLRGCEEKASKLASNGANGCTRRGMSACVKALDSQQFSFNPGGSSQALASGAGNYFDIVGECSPILCAQHDWTFSVDLDAHPVQGFSTFLSVVTGVALIIFLDIADMGSKEFGIERTAAYLESLEADDISKLPRMVISRGGHCFVPFGVLPIVVGMNDRVDEIQSAHVAYVLRLVLDSNQVKGANAQVRAEIISSLTRAKAKAQTFFGGPVKEVLDNFTASWTDIPLRDAPEEHVEEG